MALRLVVFSFFILLLSGCKAKTVVDVVVNEDGSGLVAVEVELNEHWPPLSILWKGDLHILLLFRELDDLNPHL